MELGGDAKRNRCISGVVGKRRCVLAAIDKRLRQLAVNRSGLFPTGSQGRENNPRRARDGHFMAGSACSILPRNLEAVTGICFQRGARTSSTASADPLACSV